MFMNHFKHLNPPPLPHHHHHLRWIQKQTEQNMCFSVQLTSPFHHPRLPQPSATILHPLPAASLWRSLHHIVRGNGGGETCGEAITRRLLLQWETLAGSDGAFAPSHFKPGRDDLCFHTVASRPPRCTLFIFQTRKNHTMSLRIQCLSFLYGPFFFFSHLALLSKVTKESETAIWSLICQ